MAVALCPASEALYGYYAKLGFNTILHHRLLTLTPSKDGGGAFAVCTPEAYLDARTHHFGSAPHLTLDAPYGLYALREAAYTGTHLLAGDGWHAAVKRADDQLLIRELIADVGTRDAAVAAIGRHVRGECKAITLRLPPSEATNGPLVHYAALRLLRPADIDWPQVYTNFLLTEE